jgi:hypothetical protein
LHAIYNKLSPLKPGPPQNYNQIEGLMSPVSHSLPCYQKLDSVTSHDGNNILLTKIDSTRQCVIQCDHVPVPVRLDISLFVLLAPLPYILQSIFLQEKAVKAIKQKEENKREKPKAEEQEGMPQRQQRPLPYMLPFTVS